ncbi:hypothetical protein Tco_0062866, partial [Tanacetum coccineum]
ILALSFPSSNNQLETLSDQVYQDAMKERHTLNYVDNSSKSNDDMARKYMHSNMVQHAECIKQKMLLVQLQEAWIQLSKDQLAFLADTRERINFGPGAFTVTTNAIFYADGVEVYDSDCDDVPNAQPSFMANISSYGSDALAEVHNPDNIDNNMINHRVQTTVQNSNLSSQQDALLLSMIEQLKSQPVEIDRLKQILSEHVKEKESLMKTVTLLKNDFKKEESRNIDKEICWELCIPNLVPLVLYLVQLVIVSTESTKC